MTRIKELPLRHHFYSFRFLPRFFESNRNLKGFNFIGDFNEYTEHRHCPKHQAPWQKAIAKYQTPELWRSSWQLINTLVPYAVVWYLMVLSLKVSYWLTLGWGSSPPDFSFAYSSSFTTAVTVPFSNPERQPFLGIRHRRAHLHTQQFLVARATRWRHYASAAIWTTAASAISGP